MRTLPDLGALLLAAVLLMGPQVPAQASSPAPEPSASLTTAPQVQEWISRQGQDMIRQEIAQDASAGSPVNVETWSDGVLDATDLDNPTDPTTTWVAVVSTADGPVGVLVVEAGGSEPSGMVQQDAELAANLAALPDRAIVLREPAPPSAAAAGSATASSAPSPQPSPESTTDPAAAAGDDAEAEPADPAGAIDPDAPAPPFSVLLPVYRGDRADFLRRSLASVTVEQTLRPDEVLIVRDGPVPDELEDVLARARRGELSGTVPVRVLELADNAGLALALEAGLAEAAHDVVARQDADDISVPERFATQLPLIAAGYDLVGSAIQEFDDEADTDGVIRRQPSDPEEIRRALALRDPFNHPSVVYRAAAVHAAGGYRPLDLMEDYWLFARMIHDGVRATNVPQVLVRYRVGAGAYERRGGLRLLRSELELQVSMRRAGIITAPQYARNLAVRASYRLVPTAARQAAYRAAQRMLLSRTR